MIRLSSKILVAVVATFLTFTSAAALDEPYFEIRNRTIDRLGVQETYFFVSFNEGFGRTCAHGVAFISAEYKGLYATLLAAKLSGKPLTRVDISQVHGAGSECNVKIIELGN